ncbi:MAG: hypothetical protein QM676_10260 [Novosphingobium sp.]
MQLQYNAANIAEAHRAPYLTGKWTIVPASPPHLIAAAMHVRIRRSKSSEELPNEFHFAKAETSKS